MTLVSLAEQNGQCMAGNGRRRESPHGSASAPPGAKRLDAGCVKTTALGHAALETGSKSSFTPGELRLPSIFEGA
jgi:hypothetical protein